METNCETSPTSSAGSWMFVDSSKIGKDPAEKDEFEDSDGISVISESEMNKNLSNHHSEEDEKPIVEEVEEGSSEEGDEPKQYQALTPPPTPHVEISEKEAEEVPSKELELHQEFPTVTAKEPHSHGAVLIVAMALIIALLYSNISSLKKDLAATTSIYEQRIARLEVENQQLRAQLNELIKQLNLKEEILMPSLNTEKIDGALLEENFIERQEEANRQPITKDVWLGGEKEDVVKVLDKKLNSLPDYCYFTDESDLFYEYNKENCERKQRKMEERVKKYHQKNNNHAESVDDIYNGKGDEKYDDFMAQTTDELMAALNDEIQEIKKLRVDEKTLTDDKMTKEKFNDKKKFSGKPEAQKKQQKRSFDENQEESKKKRKRPRGKDGSGGDWNSLRNEAREEARKKKDNDENWFLKRKNEREIHRLEKNIHA